MEKIKLSSKNIVEENVIQLQKMFPGIFSEGKINIIKLQEELGEFIENNDERYDFSWNGKSQAKKISVTTSTGTLRPSKESSKNWETTQNIYIEGDNLEVLKLLQKSYHKSIKMIYIDPPYNTGNEFVYSDNYSDNLNTYLQYTGQKSEDGIKFTTNSETDGRYHTNWLNMMYPRLKLSRNLLKNDGAIFISIDDNEVHNLRKLCDEIFGEDNFIASLMWRRRKTQANLTKNIAPVHDYIICYAKDKSSLSFNKLSYSDEFIIKTFKNPDNDSRGVYQTRPLAQPSTSNNPSYEITLPNGRKIIGKWSCSAETFKKYVDDDRLYIPNNGEGMPRLKIFLNESEGILPNTWLDDLATTEEGSKTIRDLFDGKQFFDFPKPIQLMEFLINLNISNNDTVLDFFSGSATTAHAVMKLNSEDDGNRKFICVQLPEPIDEKSEAFKAGYKNICEIGKERIRRAGEKLKSESGKDELDIGFKVLKLDSSNIKSWDSDFENLETNLLDVVENIKSDRNEEDLLYEILLKYGLDLTLPIEEKEVNGKKLYNIGFGALIICLDNNISIDITDEIIAIKKEYDSEITRVVFKDSGFKNATEKTNIIKTLNQNGIDEVVSV